MLELGMTDVIIFFLILGACLIFIVTWIINSESRRNMFKNEIRKLKNQNEAHERERFALIEKISALESGSDMPQVADISIRKADEGLARENRSLKDENKKLKKELTEARSSLEEVYKALS